MDKLNICKDCGKACSKPFEYCSRCIELHPELFDDEPTAQPKEAVVESSVVDEPT